MFYRMTLLDEAEHSYGVEGHPEPDDLRGAGRITDTIVTRT
jgi:hypothetical protein